MNSNELDPPKCLLALAAPGGSCDTRLPGGSHKPRLPVYLSTSHLQWYYASRELPWSQTLRTSQHQPAPKAMGWPQAPNQAPKTQAPGDHLQIQSSSWAQHQANYHGPRLSSHPSTRLASSDLEPRTAPVDRGFQLIPMGPASRPVTRKPGSWIIPVPNWSSGTKN